jgi:hypothetical protein
VFLGDPRAQNLADPQTLNSYSYAEDNQITKKDQNGDVTLLSILSYLTSSLRSLLFFLGGGSSEVNGTSGVQTGTKSTNSPSNNSGSTYTSVPIPNGYIQQKTFTDCFDACAAMLGYKPDPANRIITSTLNYNGQLATPAGAQQGIKTINTYLANGKPITVGINLNGGTNTDNTNKATEHFCD